MCTYYIYSYIHEIKLGLSVEESKKKMQLLTLATLAAENREIPYSAVSDALKVKPEEVESWVIAAIGAQLIDAKLDQIKRLVLVRYAKVL